HQRLSPGITNYMPFTAVFRAIRGIGSGMAHPKTARTEALSMMTRDNRIAPRFPRRRNSRRWSSGHTPSWVHCCRRRQHVTPLPQPISTGNRFQGTPLLRTKIIPAKAARFDTGGRPPLGDGVCFGNSGSISSHNLFGTNAAMLRLLAEQKGEILATKIRF